LIKESRRIKNTKRRLQWLREKGIRVKSLNDLSRTGGWKWGQPSGAKRGKRHKPK